MSEDKIKCPRCGGFLLLDKGTNSSEDRLRCINGDWSISRAEALELKKNFVQENKKEEIMEEKKKCTKCGIEKGLDRFSKNKANRDGFENWCRDCKALAQKRLRERRAMEKNPAPLIKEQKSGNGRRRNTRDSETTRATPDEIIKALKIGIRKEAADEIFLQLGQSLAQLRERFA